MITGVVLARNEEANIVGCLESLRPYVGELILIDMQSSDATVERARPYVDQVLSHGLIPNFDVARNIAIDVARFDWLWFLDADERVPAETGRLVNELVRDRGEEFVALTIPFKTFFCGKWIEHCGWWPGYTMPRVLRRGRFQFGAALHSGVQFDGPELRVAPLQELAIDHFSYRSVEHYLEKLNRYTSGEALNRSRQGETFNWKRGIQEMVRDLWNYYERNAGHRDGYRGWVLSWLSGQYRWLTDAKLLDRPERQADIEQAEVPSNLDEVFRAAQHELARLRASRLQLPLSICIRSPLRDASGYADDGRSLLKALALLNRDIGAQEIRWSDTTVLLSASERGLVNMLLRRQEEGAGICLTNCIPTLCEPKSEAPINILRTTFETDRLPEGWLERLARYDEIWVPSEFNRRSFRRAGVAPERLHVVPQAIDTSLYCPLGSRINLPGQLAGRFVFLSVFDWQLRKGWDVLLRSYCSEFAIEEGTGLLLKISRTQGHTKDMVLRQGDAVMAELGLSLEQRPDVVLLDCMFSAADMAALYRSANAFVLASRGEGWGRPYLEAMSSGLPTIGTCGSGNDSFMTPENSYIVETQPVRVTDQAAREIPVYAGHHWLEPSLSSMQQSLRRVFADREGASEKGKRARADAEERFGIDALARSLDTRLQAIEARTTRSEPAPVAAEQLRIELQGEFFAGHSFSNINEQLARHWAEDRSLALSLKRQVMHPTYDATDPRAHELAPYFDRPLPGGPQVTIRHAFPPSWGRPATGKWIHIQPWEFGSLPREWLVPLRDEVDEIWAPSRYVRDVYIRSGVPSHKIHLVPWGIDPAVYRPDIPNRLLPNEKSFRFLFVGGTIARKGFDLVLDAYLREFSRDDDVCLVIKDIGTKTFYRYGNFQEHVLHALTNFHAAGIVYLDGDMTPGQLASLYVACQCLVAPYRGEGFGLPILEAMACGLAPIVPQGGASDDFADASTAYLLPSRTVPCTHEWALCGEPTELSIDPAELRRTMRAAYENRQQTYRLGRAASDHVRGRFTWEATIARMNERIEALISPPSTETASSPAATIYGRTEESFGALPDLSVCVLTQNSESLLGNCLARARLVARELLIGDLGSTDRTVAIAQEYGGRVLDLHGVDEATATQRLFAAAQAQWVLALWPHQLLSEEQLERVAVVIGEAAEQEVLCLDAASAIGESGGKGQLRLLRTASAANHLRRNVRSEDVSEAASRSPPAHITHKSALSIGLVTIGYNLVGATRALIESAVRQCPHKLTFLSISHARDPKKTAELEELARRPDVVYRGYGQNRGLARSWNEGILWGFDSGQDVILVVNEDVVFAEGDVARLAESAVSQRDRFLVMGRCFHEYEDSWSWSEYSCFAFNRLALDVLGCFDENFFPIYCEDSDFRRRAALAGLERGYCEQTTIRHAGSASLKQPEVARQNERTYALNRQYYARKWGGDPGQERLDHPFNDSRFGLYIDPRTREEPYPGFNRTDRHIIQL